MSKARDLANAGTALTTVSATELGYLDGVTSAVQTQVDAKIAKTLTTTTGDIIYASSANTPARLGIGSTDQILKVSGGVPTWATPAASGGIWSQIATGSLTGSAVTVTGLTGRTLYISYADMSGSGLAGARIQLNGDTGNNYGVGSSVNTTSAGINNSFFALNGSMSDTQKYSGGVFVYFADTSLPIKPVLNIDSGDGSTLTTGFYRSTSAITSCRFFGNAGTFDAGTYYIWSMS
jgi:hypothetical protein